MEEHKNEEKTFTQAELNAIVQKRLGEEKAKYENYEELKAKALKFDELEEQNKSELQKANDKAEALQKEIDSMKRADEIRKVREEVSKELGVPTNLLSGATKEECEAQAKTVIASFKDWAKGNTYPNVKDGGEVQNKGTGGTRDQFANWFENINGGN